MPPGERFVNRFEEVVIGCYVGECGGTPVMPRPVKGEKTFDVHGCGCVCAFLCHRLLRVLCVVMILQRFLILYYIISFFVSPFLSPRSLALFFSPFLLLSFSLLLTFPAPFKRYRAGCVYEGFLATSGGIWRMGYQPRWKPQCTFNRLFRGAWCSNRTPLTPLISRSLLSLLSSLSHFSLSSHPSHSPLISLTLLTLLRLPSWKWGWTRPSLNWTRRGTIRSALKNSPPFSRYVLLHISVYISYYVQCEVVAIVYTDIRELSTFFKVCL